MASNRRVQLTLSQQITYVANVANSFQITVTASNANLMPNEIFWYTFTPPTTGFPSGQNVFMGVITPDMINSVPVNTPDLTQAQPVFRTNIATLILNDPSQANDAWNDILAAVQQLKQGLDFSDNQLQTSFWVGNPPAY